MVPYLLFVCVFVCVFLVSADFFIEQMTFCLVEISCLLLLASLEG